jgi:hypothetical protein
MLFGVFVEKEDIGLSLQEIFHTFVADYKLMRITGWK